MGGCSIIVAGWSLIQRAAIQSVINEEIHNEFIESLEAGKDIRDARMDHFVRARNTERRNSGQSNPGSSSRKGSVIINASNSNNNIDSNDGGKVGENADGSNTTNKSDADVANSKSGDDNEKTEIRHSSSSTGIVGLSKSADNNSISQGKKEEEKKNDTEEENRNKLDKKSAHLAKEYAVIERKMLLMKISLFLLFVEDLPSIILNASVYIPQGTMEGLNIPFEALVSVAISIGVIGYKVSLFEKLKLMKKREADIEIVFKQVRYLCETRRNVKKNKNKN